MPYIGPVAREREAVPYFVPTDLRKFMSKPSVSSEPRLTNCSLMYATVPSALRITVDGSFALITAFGSLVPITPSIWIL